MSATAPQDKRPLEQAKAEAMAFAAIFEDCAEQWLIAGSIRRGKRTVGDVEHVVIPIISGDRNALWERMDSLLPPPAESGTDGLFGDSCASITKAVYPDGRHRYGPKMRGVMFRGFRHEVFLADGLNWGAILAIRTGSADFSQFLVTQLKATGRYRQGGDTPKERGYVREVASGQIVPCPDEETFFELCGVKMLAPHDREVETIRKGGARR